MEVKRIINALTYANKQAYTRAFKLGNPLEWIEVPALLGILREKQGYRCVYCPRRIIWNFHLDHRIPLRIGGNHKLHNIQFTCPWCNLSKHDAPAPRTIAWRAEKEIDHTIPVLELSESDWLL